jgi:hypothetical protein
VIVLYLGVGTCSPEVCNPKQLYSVTKVSCYFYSLVLFMVTCFVHPFCFLGLKGFELDELLGYSMLF